MKRILEPALMTEEDQVRAYSGAQFEETHSTLAGLLCVHFPGLSPGYVLDLGCGPGEMTQRFAKRFPDAIFLGVDGSEQMLLEAERKRWSARARNIYFLKALVPGLPAEVRSVRWELVVSNSLLHHLPDPLQLWNEIRALQLEECPFFLTDLRRPESEELVTECVTQHASGEPEVLQRDFANSLRAAFTVAEIEAQLREAGLPFVVKEHGDRHLCVLGNRPRGYC